MGASASHAADAGWAAEMERALILLVGAVIWTRENLPVVAVALCALLGYQMLKGAPDDQRLAALAPDPIVTSALPNSVNPASAAPETMQNDPVLAFIQAMALTGGHMPTIEGGVAERAGAASISERCMALRANSSTGGTVTVSQGDFSLDDHAVQLRCLMTVQIERRFCSETVRGLVARHYALYADRLDALRVKAGSKGEAAALWHEVQASALHRSVPEDLADLIFGGYIDQSYFGHRQSQSIQTLFANVTAIPDPCYRMRAENAAIEPQR